MNSKQTAATKTAKKPPVAAMATPEPKGKAKTQTASAAQLKAAKPAVAPVIKLSIPVDATAAVVNKLISSIQGRSKKLDVDMHSAACASLNHVTLHGDPTLLNRLLNGLSKSTRRNAMVVWALKFGQVILNPDSATKAERPLVYSKEVKANIAGAIAEPFYSMQNIKEGGDAWLYMDFIGNVLKTLERHAKADPSGPEGKRAKAALDALNGVNEALAIEPAAVVH